MDKITNKISLIRRCLKPEVTISYMTILNSSSQKMKDLKPKRGRIVRDLFRVYLEAHILNCTSLYVDRETGEVLRCKVQKF